MFRYNRRNNNARQRFPRVSGDVPFVTTDELDCDLFSPRERGCSYSYRVDRAGHDVFPA